MNIGTQSLSEYLQLIASNIWVLLPVFSLLVGALVILIIQLIVKDKKSMLKTIVSLVTLIATAFCIHTVSQGVFFGGLIGINDWVTFVQYLLLAVTALVFLFPKEDPSQKHGEYHFLIITVLLGAFLLVQVRNFILFYLSLELISIASYVLITFNFNKKSFEAGIKYLLFGAVSSALMLYGISLFYGLVGSLDISALSALLLQQEGLGLWLQLAMGLFAIGVLFKLAMVPMHIWAPDIYEAGPTAVVAFISIVPKGAVLLFLLQFIVLSELELALFDWKKAFSLLAIASMLVGNLSALAQTSAKRMMAYSSIAHSGTLLIGIIVGTDFGTQAMCYYLAVYALLNLGAFYFIALFEAQGLTTMERWSGTGRKYPVFGIAILIVMLGLIGLPPTAGFTAKLLIFTSLWDYYEASGASYLLWLFVLGLLNTAIALFYYLRIPYFLFVKPQTSAIEIKYSLKDMLILLVLAFVILLLFFKADLLLNLLNHYNFTL
jgi:NADH-quinone oxidoreductase subunit N